MKPSGPDARDMYGDSDRVEAAVASRRGGRLEARKGESSSTSATSVSVTVRMVMEA